ncbi:Type I phosphodiesterase / nucleotide pyrophosphatase [Gimesia panareensis]|uniref:Type I phosphodiesterase / nucleotide pyrophosphatase n=1 Tax=Gimesia panareensis TaxID=2527978 RepID=A0A518FMJ2_9PLAN|nr:alkaline phosphatase family protein [Gimesia panareensis]QDV17527.1 Type I phosphodiesterase / nucleotide pyrophosphatase [Gimesia panareensis]
MKKVLLIVIDALATRVVQPALEQGQLPHLEKLIQQGLFCPECTSIFPSITPAATCAIATGAYPFEHGISGAYWYDRGKDEVAYFGSDLSAIMNEGMAQYLNDFQIKLNMERLCVPTIFEQIEQHGALSDAVINYMWYRGTVTHETTTPLLLNLTPGLELVSSMQGPHTMFLGDFVSTSLYGTVPAARGGLPRRFGFHDEATSDYLLALSEQNCLPDFTLAYFPNNDFESHEKGPVNAVGTLQAVDETLGALIDSQGGITAFLEEFAILIIGDHSQSDLDSSSGVDLDDVLQDFSVVEAGKAWSHSEELMVCPNMRSAQIYLRPGIWERRRDVINNLLKCPDIDQVIWCDDDHGLNGSQQPAFHVVTSERGQLVFKPTDKTAVQAVDCYGTSWLWEGDLQTVDAHHNTSTGIIEYDTYPNAFERIATCFSEQTGNIWVTARLGKEFCLPNLKCNPAGSHGSLHVLDSTAPLIAAGLPAGYELPESMRITDITPVCLQLLGVKPPRQPGASAILNPLPQRE